MSAQDDARRQADYLRRNGWRWGARTTWSHPQHGQDIEHGAALRIQFQAERAAALEKRQRDMAAVEANAGEDWMVAALEAVTFTAERRSEFTTDHVLEDTPDLPEPHDGRAWGPVMVRAKGQGLVAATDRMAASGRRSSNGRRKMVGRSLVCAGAPTMDMAGVVR
jgi:hypothetical protein